MSSLHIKGESVFTPENIIVSSYFILQSYLAFNFRKLLPTSTTLNSCFNMDI